MNVNKYAWVNKMQMQRKGAYHHTMIRTEVQMVCEHWVVMWKTRTRACITWVLAEFASTLYLASAWFQKIIQVHIISDEWSGMWWELCFLQNISPQWSDRHQCPRNMVWCICFTRFCNILFSLTWHGLLVYIYIYIPPPWVPGLMSGGWFSPFLQPGSLTLHCTVDTKIENVDTRHCALSVYRDTLRMRVKSIMEVILTIPPATHAFDLCSG